MTPVCSGQSRIVLSGPTKRRVDRTDLAQRLGAAEVGSIEHAAYTALGFVAVWQALLAARSHSRRGLLDGRKLDTAAAECQ
jgi:hypothetical protein